MPYPLAAVRGHPLVASGIVVPNTYSISGLVLDSDGATGVSGSTVALGAYSAISGVTGAYVISGIPAGTSGNLTATKTGYSWTAITISAMAANLTGQNFTNAWWAATGIAASCVLAYRAKGAASLAASYVNLANPGTNNAAPGVAPTFDTATGWTFNGTTQYLTTGYKPANNSCSEFIQFSGATADGGGLAGQLGTGNHFLQPIRGTTNHGYWNGGGVQVAGTYTSGNMGYAGTAAYKAGVGDGTCGTGDAPGNAFYIGALNAGSAQNKYAGNIQAYVFYTSVIGSSAVTMLTTVMAAL